MTLYIFVSAFPFGDTQENFLEVELPYLLEKFPKICLIPIGSHNLPQRSVPNGCIVDASLKGARVAKVLKSICGLWRVLPLYFKDFINKKRYPLAELIC